jgi:hypothetical protein
MQEFKLAILLKTKKKEGGSGVVYFVLRFFRCNAIADIDSMETATRLAANAKVDVFKMPSWDWLLSDWLDVSCSVGRSKLP